MNDAMKQHAIIIAEAGVNHNGDPDIARELVRKAAAAGADYVKFQTFDAAKLVAASAPKAEYQKENCPETGDTQLEMLRRLQLTEEDFRGLAEECARCGIGFLSSPFDLESIDFLAGLGMDYWKIPSGEITNLPFLRSIGARKGKVILSTGMSELSEIEAAMKVIEEAGTPRRDIILLHCNTQYPTPPCDVNLRAMNALETLNPGAVGYSDHTCGIAVPTAAVALGADVIEKHFTLDKSMEGPDHRASLDPDELRAMTEAIRTVEQALGDGTKHVTDSERPNMAVARKSIVAARKIRRGEILTPENITTKRPGTGLSPMMWDSVCGSAAIRDFDPDELIEI